MAVTIHSNIVFHFHNISINLQCHCKGQSDGQLENRSHIRDKSNCLSVNTSNSHGDSKDERFPPPHLKSPVHCRWINMNLHCSRDLITRKKTCLLLCEPGKVVAYVNELLLRLHELIHLFQSMKSLTIFGSEWAMGGR